MTFYLVITALLFVVGIILRPDLRQAGRNTFALTSFASLAIIAAIRAPTVGADTLQYYSYFTLIGRIDWQYHKVLRFEPGYFLLNKVVFAFSQDPQVFIAVASVFVIAVCIWFAWRYAQDLVLTVCLFLLLQGYAFVMTALRQAIAMAIVLLVVPQLLKHRYLVFGAGVLLAMQFHSSAVVLFALIPLVRLRMRARTLLIYLVATPLLAVLAGTVLTYAASSDDRYTTYVQAVAGSGGKSGVLLILIVYFVLLGITTATMVRRRTGPDRALAGPSDLTFLVYTAWLIIPVLGSAFGSTAYLRFSYYFIIFVAIAVPGAIQRIENPGLRRTVSYSLVVTAIAYFIVVSTFRPEWYSVIPYHTF